MSTRAYKPGDIIQNTCEPFVKILDGKWRGTRCNNCFLPSSSSITLSQCDGCKLMYYCSPACQKHDWKHGHKIECPSNCFREYQSDSKVGDSNSFLKVLRLYALLRLKPELAEKKVVMQFNGEERCLNDLKKFITTEEKKLALRTLDWTKIGFLMNFDDFEIEIEILMEAHCLFKNYGYVIYDEVETLVIGFGLYLETSFLIHSCSPNSFFCNFGPPLQIRAIADIKEGDAVSINFTEILATRDVRRAVLYERYSLNCLCKRCDSNEKEIDYKKLQNLIHEFNSGTKAANAKNKLNYFFNLHTEILSLFRKIYSEYHESITNQHLRLFASLKVYKDSISAKRLARQAEEISNHVLITFGAEHIVYKILMNEMAQLKIKF